MSIATPLRHSGEEGHYPSPRSPTLRLSRSPKRAKSTPSPDDLLSRRSLSASTGSTSSTRSGQSGSKLHRRPESETRGFSFEGHAMTSPWRFEDGHERRREMSVPLLSQTLSSFSLSHSPEMGRLRSSTSSSSRHTPTTIPFHIPSPSSQIPLSQTPRQPSMLPLRTPSYKPPRSDHVYPSTAPLPQIPSFLGSPFSSKTARGRYDYHSMSPSRGVMTEHLEFEEFEPPTFDWNDQSEWMVEEELSLDFLDDSPGRVSGLPRPARLRRDTSGSTSSLDEYGGSTTSSASLLSLARSSGEHGARPTNVSIWSEQTKALEEQDGHPETPSRHPFAASEDVAESQLHLHAYNTPQDSPGMSPLVGRTISTKKAINEEISPLQAFLMARTPSGKSLQGESALSSAKSKSPFSTLLPRLISSRKTTKKQFSLASFEKSTDRNADLIDTDDNLTDFLNSSTSSTASDDRTDRVIGLGIGLPRRKSTESRAFGRSVSGGSSSDVDPSPSKNPSKLSSSSSTLPTPPLGPSRPPTSIARRKTLAIQPAKKTPAVAARARPTRPFLRRGITEPKAFGTPQPDLLSPATAKLSTPVGVLFGDVRPSPAAFASTGLVKKKSIMPGLEIPRFGESEPKKRASPVKPLRSRLAIMTSAATDSTGSTRSRASAASVGSNATRAGSIMSSDASVSVYVRVTQKARGLRRKTSSMFTASGSIGSIADLPGGLSTSPLTPTKPGIGLRITPADLGITTPSPTTPTNLIYPFAPSTSFSALSSPPTRHSEFHPASDATEVSSPAERPSLSSRPSLLRNAPLARTSNPMLANSFRAQSETTGYRSLHRPKSRLERDFVIVQKLGRGEFSQVWQVREKMGNRLFAVKAGKPYSGYKNRLRQLEEVSILRHLSLNPHPHILTFVDSWEHAQRLYIRTELAACGDLAVFLLSLGDAGGMGEARVWKVFSELSSALEHIHGHNFLHLDIKPSNILINNLGALKIADFGMSTIITDAGTIGGVSPALPEAVDDGGFVWKEETVNIPVPSPILDREVEGDREYLCPEALGDGVVGKESDVFSLGIMLLEAALNVVLPSNGDGWVRLRNDDFSDLKEHYVLRGGYGDDNPKHGNEQCDEGENLPEISRTMLEVIKAMMRSDSETRMTLGEIRALQPIIRIEEMKRDGLVQAALVEENDGFLGTILA